jgi:hypothetical protein
MPKQCRVIRKAYHFKGVMPIETFWFGETETDVETGVVLINTVTDRPVTTIGPDTERTIESHSWPGVPRP